MPAAPLGFDVRGQMSQPTLERAAEALAISLVVPAAAVTLLSLNPLLGLWIAGVGLVHALILGLPAFLLLRRLGWVNIGTSTLTGFVVGTGPAAIAFSEIPGQFVPLAGFGAASGFLFGAWLWVRVKMGPNPSLHPPTSAAGELKR